MIDTEPPAATSRGGAPAADPVPAPDTPDRGPLVVPQARSRLDREQILVAALRLLDDEGLRGFTMRTLGARLGVEAMALYRYFTSRDALLDGVVEYVIDDLHADPDIRSSAPHWPEYLTRLAHGMRRIALAHPEVFPLIATRPPAAPWLRPPLRSLRWMEAFLSTLRVSGFSDAAAVAAYRGYSSFLLGHLLLEVAALGGSPVPTLRTAAGAPAPDDLADYPLLQRLKPMLARNRSAEEFDEALESLLDRLRTHV